MKLSKIIEIRINIIQNVIFFIIRIFCINYFLNFKNNGKIMLYTNLLNTNAVEINDMTIGIEFPNGITAFNEKVINFLAKN